MDNKTLGIASGIAAVAAVTGTLLIGHKDTPIELPPLVPITEPATEAETAGTVIKLSNGKIMHVFGVYNDKQALVIDSVHGRTVVLTTITGDVTCNLLLDAKVVVPTQTTITKTVNGKSIAVTVVNPELPDVPKLAKVFGVVSWPVRIPESCTKEGKCLWEVLLRGEACKTAGEDPSFVASSPKEFATLPSGTRDRAKALASWFDKE